MLVAVILIAGYTVYRIIQPQIEAMVVNGVRVVLENKVKLIENRIAYSLDNIRVAANRILLMQSLERLSDDESHAEGLDEVGIETVEQLNILRQQKCDYFQGYYFSKPVAASEIERMLKKSARTDKLRVIRFA